MAEQFYEGSLPIDEFVKSFHEKRALYHTRKVKADKIVEQLRNQQAYRPISEPIYPHPSTVKNSFQLNFYFRVTGKLELTFILTYQDQETRITISPLHVHILFACYCIFKKL